MKRVAWVACVVGLVALSGCAVSRAKYKALLAQNQIQSARIKGLDREIAQAQIELEALEKQLAALTSARESSGRLVTAKDAQIAVLKSRCADLEARVADLGRLIAGRKLPVPDIPGPVRNALKDLAAQEPSLEFDEETGACKFASDVLFDSGKDTVKSSATAVLRKFAAIFTGVGKGLHLRIEGHTDDRRIAKAATRARHPTNWHLSAHRAISVLTALEGFGVEEERMSAAGFGKWRPAGSNSTAAGRAKNRRVEIYVVSSPVAVERVAAEPSSMGGE